MKNLLVWLIILVSVAVSVLLLNSKHEERRDQETYAHLMQSPLSTSLHAIADPESGDIYYSVKYVATHHEGYEVFEIGNLRLFRKGDSEFSPGGASGSIVLPGDKWIPELSKNYSSFISIFGNEFEIVRDELIIGSTRLRITDPEPQRVPVDSNWNPSPDA